MTDLEAQGNAKNPLIVQSIRAFDDFTAVKLELYCPKFKNAMRCLSQEYHDRVTTTSSCDGRWAASFQF
jgi:hypothetical protein